MMENVQNVNHKLKLFTKFDALLILFFVIISLFFLVTSTKIKTKPDIVEVRVSNRIVKTLPIGENGIYTVKGSIGESTFEIRNNKVRMTHSPCSNKICINEGWIEKISENIVCIPNKVTITLLNSSAVQNTQKNSVDSVSR